jgi:4-amino-4-deoxy-L-arabinose transferase-like glycosyltransferase
MSERIAGYLLAGILVTIFKIRKTQSNQLYFIFFLLGFIYNTKQFFSIIVIILFFIFLMSSKYRKNAPFILGAFTLQEIAYSTYFTNATKNYHTTQIDILDTLQDLFLFRDLNLSNIIEIMKNLSMDKPFMYFLLITIGWSCLELISKKSSYELKIYIIITILNLLFIFILYISAWRNMELESPIRYIYSFLPMYLIMIPTSLERLEGNN